jgi:hypothetical protein
MRRKKTAKCRVEVRLIRVPMTGCQRRSASPSSSKLPLCHSHALNSQLLRNVSALSEARFHKSVKSGEVLFARSIEPFEGGHSSTGLELD